MPLDRESVSAVWEQVKEEADQVIRTGVFELVAQLKAMSPVDTGRFRAGWTVGKGSTTPPPLPPGEYPTDPGIRMAGVSFADVGLGADVGIWNNTEYAEHLNQAAYLPDHEPGWIDDLGEQYTEVIEMRLEAAVQQALEQHLT